MDTSVIDARPAPAPSGLRRIAAISTSLVSTQAATSVLGLLFWGLAARRFSVSAVGVAGAAISLMTLLASLGTLGLGTLLIARLPHTVQGSRRVLVRTALVLAGGATVLIALVVPFVSITLFGAGHLSQLAGSPSRALVFAVGTGLASVALVLDQAVLVLGSGSLQLERNVVASATKLAALVGFSALGHSDGLTVFVAWAIGTLVSLPVVAWRTRGGRSLETGRRLIDFSSMRGLGRSAVGHHALNTTLMAPLTLLPLIVTVTLSTAANGIFTTALQVTGFVFALPYAVSIGLFAAAEGDERQVLDRMRFTIPFGLGVSLLADVVLYVAAPFVLSIFGSVYADQGVSILRVLVLAGLAFVIKDHFVALRRVQGRTLEATGLLAGFTVFELCAALFGARADGTLGLCAYWVGALMIEAIILAVPLFRGARQALTDQPAEPNAAESGATPLAGRLMSRTGSVPLPDLFTPAPGSPPQSEQNLTSGRDVRRRAARRVFGVGPVVLLMSLGLLCVAWAVNLALAAQHDAAAQVWYVTGLVAIFLPAAIGVLLPGTSRTGRIVLAVAMPVLLQLSRLMLYPTRFMFHDELLHADGLRLIEVTGRLFTENPLLPITSYYPGLEIATDAVHDLTGFSSHTSAVVVLLAARIVMALAVITVIERLTFSTRIGAVAGIIYATNPQLLFFNSQYSYQTIALPLALLTIHLYLSRPRGHRTSLVLPMLTLVAVVFSHHITAALLVVAFGVWLLLEVLLRRRRDHEIASLAVMTATGVAAIAASVLNPGNSLGSYLSSIFVSSETALTQFAQGKQSKQLFQNSAGVGTPSWEQALLVASLGIVLLVLIPALIKSREWVKARTSAAVLIALAALLYPLIPAGHLTMATAEVGDRSAGFVFIGVGFVVSCWICRHRIRAWHAWLFGAAAIITFLGGVVLGAGTFAQQLPGPYEVSSDARSLDPANLAAAQWISTHLPAESRVYADRESGLLAGAYGDQYVVTHIGTGIDASRLLLDPSFGAVDRQLIRQAGIRYLIVDRRDAFGLPNEGVYIESGEFGEQGRTAPVPAAALSKFDDVPGVDRIYDNGSITVYDLGALDGNG